MKQLISNLIELGRGVPQTSMIHRQAVTEQSLVFLGTSPLKRLKEVSSGRYTFQ